MKSNMKSKLNYPKVIMIVCIFAITIVVYFGSIGWIMRTPHCQLDGIGYYCDIFASKTEKQNMCVEDSLMNNPSHGTRGYNADTGKEFILSDAEQKAMYNFIVESCK